MQFQTIVAALFAGLAVASPLIQERAPLCSSSLDTAQCCDASVDGVLVLECSTRMRRPFPLHATSTD